MNTCRPPTLRELVRGDFSDEQAKQIEESIVRRRTWTRGEIAAVVFAAFMVGTAVALVGLLLGSISGCAPSDPVYVDRRFSADEQAEIQAAADYWCNATGGAACVDLVFGAHVGRASKTTSDGRRVLVRMTESDALASPSPLLSSGRKSGSRWVNTDELGFSSEEVIAIVPSRIGPGYLRTVVAHELGHHFDMNHVATPGALMVDTGETSEIRSHVEAGCLTAADIAELCNSHACGQPKECTP